MKIAKDLIDLLKYLNGRSSDNLENFISFLDQEFYFKNLNKEIQETLFLLTSKNQKTKNHLIEKLELFYKQYKEEFDFMISLESDPDFKNIPQSVKESIFILIKNL